jgi:threonine aldolase
MDEHVILVAIQVRADNRTAAMAQIMESLKTHGPHGDDNVYGIECWWLAEDDRTDGSDCDSAVFVNPGGQAQASRVLHNTIARDPHTWDHHEPIQHLTSKCNIVDRKVNDQFDGGPV